MKAIKDLYCDAVNVSSVAFDFSDVWGKSWETIYPESLKFSILQCCKILDDAGYHKPEAADRVGIWREYVWGYYQTSGIYNPSMNYYYPLPGYDGNPVLDQLSLGDNVAVMLVEVNGTPVFALSGGGKNPGWDICYAYVLMGYLPPITFCNLPEFAGLKLDAKTKRVLAACLRTADVIKNRAQDTSKKLRDYRKWLRALSH